MKLLQLLVLFFIVALCFALKLKQAPPSPEKDRDYTKQYFEIPEQKTVQYPEKPSSEFVSKIEIPKEQKTTSTTTKNSKKCYTQPVCTNFKNVILENGKDSIACESWETKTICESSEDEERKKKKQKN